MSIISLLVAAKNAWADRRRRTQAYAELISLDDRSLADIGIHRSRIPASSRASATVPFRSRPASRPPPILAAFSAAVIARWLAKPGHFGPTAGPGLTIRQ